MELNLINELKGELDGILKLSDETKTNLLNVFTSWYSCKSKHSYITNINNSKINLNKQINIDGILSNYLSEETELNKITLFIEDCNNLEINISEKFNHLILLNCNNININIESGIISGIDILHSEYININVQFNKIYTINYQNSRFCIINFIDIFSSDNQEINNCKIITYCCYDIVFNITNNLIYKHFKTNMSLFSGMIYFIIKNNFDIDYIDRNGTGQLC